MDPLDLIREAVATGKLREPFSAREAVRALSQRTWPITRLQSFLVRHCQGNLAATTLLFERVSYGKYRLLYDGPRGPVREASSFRRRPARPEHKEIPTLPGESEP
jgi:hypothetical protein